MKYIITLLMILILSTSAFAVTDETEVEVDTISANADDDDESDEEDEEDLDEDEARDVLREDKDSRHNAAIAGLKFHVARAIAAAEAIIDYVDERGDDTDELEEVLDELIALQESIDNDMTRDEFSDAIQEGRQLVQKFKSIAQDLVPESERKEVRERVTKAILSDDRVQDLEEEAENLREEYNERRIDALEKVIEKRLENADEETREKVENLLDRLEEGRLTKAEVRELKAEIGSNIRESAKKRLAKVVRKKVKDSVDIDKARAVSSDVNRLRDQLASGEISEREFNERMAELRKDAADVVDSDRIEEIRADVKDRIDTNDDGAIDRKEARAAHEVVRY